MDIRATATFTGRGDLGRFIQARVTPRVRAGIEAAAQQVYAASQIFVPVDTGELKASGAVEIRETEKSVVADIVYTAPHSGYVEYGTGAAGAASAGAGPYPYTLSWPGMPAQPYLRPALDLARSQRTPLNEVALRLRT